MAHRNPVLKKPAAAQAEVQAAVQERPKPTTKSKADSEPPSQPPAKVAKTAPPEQQTTLGSDSLGLSELFSGLGHGAEWEAIIRPVLESLPNAAEFIGPGRDKRIVPVREMTFQALKPNPPSKWRVISFGQSPYPRIESATGIAHFDNAVTSWESKRFGAIVTMRCIIKAAAMCKHGVAKTATVDELRHLMKRDNCVGPAEWFQAMLAQGVLFMNVACTLLREDKTIRAGSAVEAHTKFWHPVIEAVVDAILESCRREGHGIVFAWWGFESLKTKKKVTVFGMLPRCGSCAHRPQESCCNGRCFL